ncbi:MAG: SIMPL domain-containing protein [Anaerolineae bacterium]|jgi:hypothetical protein
MWKRILWIGLTVAVLLTVALGGAWLWDQVAVDKVAAQDVAATDYSPSQIITVVGRGSTSVEPDIARVSVGVETSAATIAEAVDENEAQMESVLGALREAGIADKDIQTTNFSISLDRYPEQVVRSDEGQQAQPVYRVSNMVNVTIRDLDQVGAVLDAVIESGANNIWGVSFTIDDPAEAQAEARADAVENARERAQALAELSGVELGPVMSVSEVVSGGGVPMVYDTVVERAAGAGTSISPGELEISYQVQVSYFIEP